MKITTCRFCGKQAPNHDHDECAEKYRKVIEEQLFHFATDPHTKLTSDYFQKITLDTKWKYFLEYRERIDRQKKIFLHREKIRQKIHEELDCIIHSPVSKKRLQKHNTPFEGESFVVRISYSVSVEVEPRY